MDTDESAVLSQAMGSYVGGTTNPGGYYQRGTGGHESAHPLPPGTPVVHARSGQAGVVSGSVGHGGAQERLPTVRWDGMPASGGTNTFDQGYSLDSLTTP